MATAAMTNSGSTAISSEHDIAVTTNAWNLLISDTSIIMDHGVDIDADNSTSMFNWTASLDRDLATTGDPLAGFPYPSLYSWPHIVAASTAVTVVMLAIIFGNGLVVVAIAVDRGLRGLQNWFVASLAVSDLLVGLFIMPLTLTNELIGYWPFGDVVCELWLSTDVLLCTASILNLCLISLDRYWSIVRPIAYVRSRTPRRAATMISIVWVLSMVICLPPLVGWKRPQPTKYERYPLCVLSEEPGYIIYSSMGSFYLPLVVMVLVYFKIYLAARDRARRNLKSKTKKLLSTTNTSASSTVVATTTATKTCNIVSEDVGCRQLMSTMHRSGLMASPSIGLQEPDSFIDFDSDDDAIVVAGAPPVDGIEAEVVEHRADDFNEVSACSSFETRFQSAHSLSDNIVSTSKSFSSSPEVRGETNENRPMIEYHLVSTGSGNGCGQGSDDDNNDRESKFKRSAINRNYLNEPTSPETPIGHRTNDADSRMSLLNSPPGGVPMKTDRKGAGERNVGHLSISVDPKQRSSLTDGGNSSLSPNVGAETAKQLRHSTLFPVIKNYFRLASPTKKAAADKSGTSVAATATPAPDPERTKRKMARARERRATLVLGIVMASFIGCWLPFFAIYPATALAGVGVPPSLFAVIFWLGYCNSALNPIIYTIFNRDFRAAFGRILCTNRRRHQRGMLAGGGGGGRG